MSEKYTPVHGRGVSHEGGGFAEIIVGGKVYPAAFIVRAVNSHDMLVAAAETHLMWIEREQQGPLYPARMTRDSPGGEAIWRAWWDDQIELCARTEEQCRAGLALARGEPLLDPPGLVWP